MNKKPKRTKVVGISFDITQWEMLEALRQEHDQNISRLVFRALEEYLYTTRNQDLATIAHRQLTEDVAADKESVAWVKDFANEYNRRRSPRPQLR